MGAKRGGGDSHPSHVFHKMLRRRYDNLHRGGPLESSALSAVRIERLRLTVENFVLDLWFTVMIKLGYFVLKTFPLGFLVVWIEFRVSIV